MSSTQDLVHAMNPVGLNHYIEDCVRVLKKLGTTRPIIGQSHLLSPRDKAYDYSAYIEVSGKVNGVVLFTCDSDTLVYLTRQLIRIEPDQAVLQDSIGEITNMLASRAHELFPASDVSLPRALGREMTMPSSLRHPAIVIPIEWKENAASLIIGLS